MQLRGMLWRVLRCYKTSVVINQNSLSGAEQNGENVDGHSLKCSPLEGFITPRKVEETSTQLHGFEECHG